MTWRLRLFLRSLGLLCLSYYTMSAWSVPRASRSISGLPAACFACMMAATFSLSAACWEPDMVVLFFYRGCQKMRDMAGKRQDIAIRTTPAAFF